MFGNIFTQSQQMFNPFAKFAQEQLKGAQAIESQLNQMQVEQVRRMTETIDESARLMKETVSYWSQLGTEWRKVGIESTKKAAETAGA